MTRRTPSGLGAPGRRFWRDVTTAYALSAGEEQLLEQAAKTLDELAILEVALNPEPLLIAGSKGQKRVHPLLGEVRQHRLLFTRLVAALELPAEAGESGWSAASASSAGRRMALVKHYGRSA